MMELILLSLMGVAPWAFVAGYFGDDEGQDSVDDQLHSLEPDNPEVSQEEDLGDPLNAKLGDVIILNAADTKVTLAPLGDAFDRLESRDPETGAAVLTSSDRLVVRGFTPGRDTLDLTSILNFTDATIQDDGFGNVNIIASENDYIGGGPFSGFVSFASGDVFATIEAAESKDVLAALSVDMHGTSSDDVFENMQPGAKIYGEGGNDTLTAGGIRGFYNDDVGGVVQSFNGFYGDDQYIDGGAGDDLLIHEHNFDFETELYDNPGAIWHGEIFGETTLLGGEGDDTILSFAHNDTLLGAEGNDVIDSTGSPQWASPVGRAPIGHFSPQGSLLSGGAGNDTLLANQGDTLEGGAGQDNFGFNHVNVVGDYDWWFLSNQDGESLLRGAAVDFADNHAEILDFNLDEDTLEIEMPKEGTNGTPLTGSYEVSLEIHNNDAVVYLSFTPFEAFDPETSEGTDYSWRTNLVVIKNAPYFSLSNITLS